MELGPSSNAINLIESIGDLNEMLMNASNAQLGVSEKIMKANVCVKVAGLGENVDIRA